MDINIHKIQTINKEKIAEFLKEKLGFSVLVSEEITTHIFSQILDISLNNGKLVLPNFGKFQIYQKDKRPGVNFQTREVMEIKPRRVLRFNASMALKAKVNSHEID